MDNATPSGNSIAAMSLMRLALLTGNEAYRRYATTILRLIADQIRRYPSAFGFALTALDFYLASPVEIALVANDRASLFGDLWRAVWSVYLPNRVIALAVADTGEVGKNIPLLLDRRPIDSRSTAFVCQRYVCQAPTHSPDVLLAQLATK